MACLLIPVDTPVMKRPRVATAKEPMVSTMESKRPPWTVFKQKKLRGPLWPGVVAGSYLVTVYCLVREILVASTAEVGRH